MIKTTCYNPKALWNRLNHYANNSKIKDVAIIGYEMEDEKLVGVTIRPIMKGGKT